MSNLALFSKLITLGSEAEIFGFYNIRDISFYGALELALDLEGEVSLEKLSYFSVSAIDELPSFDRTGLSLSDGIRRLRVFVEDANQRVYRGFALTAKSIIFPGDPGSPAWVPTSISKILAQEDCIQDWVDNALKLLDSDFIREASRKYGTPEYRRNCDDCLYGMSLEGETLPCAVNPSFYDQPDNCPDFTLRTVFNHSMLREHSLFLRRLKRAKDVHRFNQDLAHFVSQFNPGLVRCLSNMQVICESNFYHDHGHTSIDFYTFPFPFADFDQKKIRVHSFLIDSINPEVLDLAFQVLTDGFGIPGTLEFERTFFDSFRSLERIVYLLSSSNRPFFFKAPLPSRFQVLQGLPKLTIFEGLSALMKDGETGGNLWSSFLGRLKRLNLK